MTVIRRTLAAPVLAAVLLTGLAFTTGSPAEASVLLPSPTSAACAPTGHGAPVRVSRFLDNASPSAVARVSAANGLSAAELTRQSTDPSLRLGPCGAAFYADPVPSEMVTQSARTTARSLATGLNTPPADVLALDSRPSANVTIYLDFTGDNLTGTLWNYSPTPIPVAPFSINGPATTDFDADERRAIFDAWQIVAEAYSPFDINVTTAEPSADALDRRTAEDPRYGIRVLIARKSGLPSCTCAGMAAVGAMTEIGEMHTRNGTALILADVLGDAKHIGGNMGAAAAHEAGHTFGLHHDGNATRAYQDGAPEYTWAPIMGASYYSLFGQWSDGDYTGANNTEDDTAIIAASAPILADDAADDPADATPLNSEAPLDGLISTRDDVDAFAFLASGTTTIEIDTPSDYATLHTGFRIVDSDGNEVASLIAPVPYGLAIEPGHSPFGAPALLWHTDLPPVPARYTLLVDGVGNNERTTGRSFSDYGSLGTYRVTLNTDPSIAVATTSISTTAGRSARAHLANLGTLQNVHWAATSVLPDGLSLADDGTIIGTPTTVGTYQVGVTVTDGTHHDAATLQIDVTRPPAAPPAPKFSTAGALPGAVAGKPYSASIAATASTPAYAWSLTGALPAGLSANTTTGEDSLAISGTPTEAGTVRFVATITDANGKTRARTFKIRVRAASTRH